ncbi:unnamed protein product [Absidia cylindrospora]
MNHANEHLLASKVAPVLELQQQYHFIAQLTSHDPNESKQILWDGNEAPDDYWGDEWSEDDELRQDQQLQPTTCANQKHTNGDSKYYPKWSEYPDTMTPGPLPPRRLLCASAFAKSGHDSDDDDQTTVAALQELTRILHQTLPSSRTPVALLNPLPKAIQRRYEWEMG